MTKVQRLEYEVRGAIAIRPGDPGQLLTRGHPALGNVFRALQTVEDLDMDVEAIESGQGHEKLLKALRDFEHYISVNATFIPNYGDRYRNGEHIATGFVESTVNQVISKRFVKKQSMRWTERGAHLLLQSEDQNTQRRASPDV